MTVRHDIVIGRGADCNLRLSAPQVSRRHCFLRIGAEGAFISDLDSSNGTVLNGDKLSSGKRYAVNDGAVLSVGPVKFIVRVHAEVLAGDVLEVHVAGDQLEADAAFKDSQADGNFDATLAVDSPEDGGGLVNFSIEHGGPSADPDEPTADCVAADLGGLRRKGSGTLAQALQDSDAAESILGDLPLLDDEPPTAVVAANVGELSEEVHELSDEAIELIDVEEVVELDESANNDDRAEVVEDDLIDIIEEVDDEVLLIDEEDIVEIVEDFAEEAGVDAEVVGSDADYEAGDSVGDDFRDFLQGLD